MEVDRPIDKDEPIAVTLWKTHVGHTKKQKLLHTKKQVHCSGQVCVVLPAAGQGERMEQAEHKQFMLLCHRPVVLHTVQAFLKLPIVDRVVVIAAPDAVERMVKVLSPAAEGQRLLVAKGCNSRHASIRAGLRALKTRGRAPDIVIIHDAVRPFIPEEIVTQVVKEAKSFGAAGVVCPLVSTVVRRDSSHLLKESLDRSQYWASEMPQAFQYSLIAKVYEECSAEDIFYGTECLKLVLKYGGVRAKLIEAPEHMWKITHLKDIFAAEGVMKGKQNIGVVYDGSCPKNLLYVLQSTFADVQLKRELCEDDFRSEAPYWVVFSGESLCCPRKSLPYPVSLVFVVRHTTPPFDAKAFKKYNLLVYFVLHPPSVSDFTKEWCELVVSLLRDSNPHICGTVFSCP